MKMNQPAAPRVDWSKGKDIVCEDCGEGAFDMIFRLKKVPGIMSPTGLDIIGNFQKYICKKCGKELDLK